MMDFPAVIITILLISTVVATSAFRWFLYARASVSLKEEEERKEKK